MQPALIWFVEETEKKFLHYFCMKALLDKSPALELAMPVKLTTEIDLSCVLWGAGKKESNEVSLTDKDGQVSC